MKIDELKMQHREAQEKADAIAVQINEAEILGKAGARDQILALMGEGGITLQDLGCARRRRAAKPPAVDAAWPDAAEETPEVASV